MLNFMPKVYYFRVSVVLNVLVQYVKLKENSNVELVSVMEKTYNKFQWPLRKPIIFSLKVFYSYNNRTTKV